MSTELQKNFEETPDTIHGRLLEAFHITGYSAERACLSLEWLLEDDRWKQVGNGFGNIDAFLSTLNLSHLKIAREQRKRLAKKLDDLQATQRATAGALGASKSVINRDLAPVPKGTKQDEPSADLDDFVPNGTQPAPLEDKPTPIDTRSKMHEQVMKRDEKQRTTARKELPKNKTYGVIYADPPWDYGLNNRTGWGGDASTHYTTMKLDEICALPIQDLADADCVLFLWVTSPFLEKSFQVIHSWGFAYKASFVWDKVKHNMGHYNSVRHEFLLVCTKGSATPEQKQLFDSVQSIERTEKHSSKPGEFRDIINTLYPSAKKIELFSRAVVDGWDSWGNENEAF